MRVEMLEEDIRPLARRVVGDGRTVRVEVLEEDIRPPARRWGVTRRHRQAHAYHHPLGPRKWRQVGHPPSHCANVQERRAGS